MATIKTRIESEIFDDSEYCETGSDDREDTCDFLQYHDGDDNHRCYQFPIDHEPRILEMNWQTMQFKKCPECKKAWNEAKELEKLSLDREKITKLCPKCGHKLNHLDGCDNDDCFYPPRL